MNTLLAEMRASASSAAKDLPLRAKFAAVARWLLGVACCSGFEDMHDAVVELAEVRHTSLKNAWSSLSFCR
jgi:hypothetical protein